MVDNLGLRRFPSLFLCFFTEGEDLPPDAAFVEDGEDALRREEDFGEEEARRELEDLLVEEGEPDAKRELDLALDIFELGCCYFQIILKFN